MEPHIPPTREVRSISGVPPSAPEPRKTLRLEDVGRFLAAYWLLIVGLAFLGGLSFFFLSLGDQQDVYEASVTLVVMPPGFGSELNPSSLTVQGYQKILESDAVLAATRERLVAAGHLPPSASLVLGGRVQSRIFASAKSDSVVLAPMIKLVGRGDTGEQAAAIADTWSTVFLERVRDLVRGSTSATVEFIEEEYPRSEQRLMAIEDARAALADRLETTYYQRSIDWEGRIAARRREAASVEARYETETARLLTELKATSRLDTRRARLQGIEQAHADYEGWRGRIDADLAKAELEQSVLEAQLVETPETVTLKKTFSDDALLLIAREGPAEGEQSDAASFQTEVLNPSHQRLSLMLTEVDTTVGVLGPAAEKVEGKLGELADTIEALTLDVGAREAELSELRKVRDAGFFALRSKNETAIRALELKRDEELARLERHREKELSQLSRSLTQEGELARQLAGQYNQAVLAKAQQGSEEIRVAAPAVPPERPLSRSRNGGIYLGIFLGLILGLVVAFTHSVVTLGRARS